MGEIGGVVLAAGASTRLGERKQLLTFNGEPLVHSAVRAAREGGCNILCVVTGHEYAEVENAVADLHPVIVRNPDWSGGIGTSIRAGLHALGHASAVILLTCDQPAVRPQIVRSLIGLYRETSRPIIACRYAGTAGIPVLFDQSCFADLRALPDDQGAKRLIEADPERIGYLDFPDGEFDLDTPADIRGWMARPI